MARSHCLSSSEICGQAATDALEEGKNALGAALAGFFSAAGAHPGVLLSPMVLLLGGTGSGVYTFDGRARQPGLDEKRPRGFLDGDPIPMAARAAAPCSIPALAVACAFHPGTSLLAAVKEGVKAAKRSGADKRAHLLDKVASLGARSLSDPALRRSLLGTFGAVEGGLLGPYDLAPRDGLSGEVRSEGGVYRPALSEAAPSDSEGLGEEHALVAVDSQGLFAALSFYELSPRCEWGDYECYLPAQAVPVRRGVSRVPPGTALESRQDLRLQLDEQGRIASVSACVTHGRTLKLFRDYESKQVSPALGS